VRRNTRAISPSSRLVSRRTARHGRETITPTTLANDFPVKGVCSIRRADEGERCNFDGRWF
jgi:hypothetical protein